MSRSKKKGPYVDAKLLARIDMPVPLPGLGFQGAPEITVVSDVLADRRVEPATVLELLPSSGSRSPSALPASGRGLLPRGLLPLVGRALAGFPKSG